MPTVVVLYNSIAVHTAPLTVVRPLFHSPSRPHSAPPAPAPATLRSSAPCIEPSRSLDHLVLTSAARACAPTVCRQPCLPHLGAQHPRRRVAAGRASRSCAGRPSSAGLLRLHSTAALRLRAEVGVRRARARDAEVVGRGRAHQRRVLRQYRAALAAAGAVCDPVDLGALGLLPTVNNRERDEGGAHGDHAEGERQPGHARRGAVLGVVGRVNGLVGLEERGDVGGEQRATLTTRLAEEGGGLVGLVVALAVGALALPDAPLLGLLGARVLRGSVYRRCTVGSVVRERE